VPIWGLWTLWALILAGCQTAPEPNPIFSTEIFEDIPAPATARVQTDDAVSFAYHSESFRCAKYVYSFEGRIDDAVAFFHEVMVKPPYSWKLGEQADLPAGHARMDFRKGEEYCTVDLRRMENRSDQTPLVLITIRVNYQ
jgi:hypothetical protein